MFPKKNKCNYRHLVVVYLEAICAHGRARLGTAYARASYRLLLRELLPMVAIVTTVQACYADISPF